MWLHVSWFAVLVLVVWTVTVEFGDVLPGLPIGERFSMAAVTGLAFFGCLTLHEVAHAVVARRFGVRVKSITLFLFGGVAEIEGELPSPGSEFAVALAGPAVSVAIGSTLAIAARIADGLAWTGAAGVLFTLALVNLGVAVFNLVPGLPLDGGRILRAAIWHGTGDLSRATRVAAAGGRVVSAALVAVGVLATVLGHPEGLWYMVMGVFIWVLARAAGRAVPPGQSRALALSGEGEAA